MEEEQTNLTVVVPCCGESTRYGGKRPKWALTHPNGRLMAVAAVEPFMKMAKDIVFVVRNDQLDALGCSPAELELFVNRGLTQEKIFVVPVDSAGSHAADCAQGVDAYDISGPVLFKDCDNVFELDEPLLGPRDAICTVRLADAGVIDAANKSYVTEGEGWSRTADGGVSDRFACGGYYFADARRFARAVKASGAKHPLEVCYMHGLPRAGGVSTDARIIGCRAYEDWGTVDDWKRYRATWKTVFCDLDGVLVEAGHPLFSPRWGECKPIVDNCQRVRELVAAGRTRVVLTTARPSSMEYETRADILRAELGSAFADIIFDLPHAARFLVNDVVQERGEQTAHAINLPRNAGHLRWML